MIRPSLDTVFMAMVDCLRYRAMCKRLQVACIITRDKRVITSGVNGPNTWDCDELRCDTSKPCAHSIHAEDNAIKFALEHNVSLEGTTVYVSHQPCIDCAKILVEYKIARVVYAEPYRLASGLDYLIANGVEVTKFEI